MMGDGLLSATETVEGTFPLGWRVYNTRLRQIPAPRNLSRRPT